MRGMVARAVLNTPEGSRLYLKRLDSLRASVFTDERLQARVEEFHQRIRPTLAAYDPEMARRHDGAVASLSRRISHRVQSLNEQLSQSRDPIGFDASGTVTITNWTVRSSSQASGFTLDSVQDEGKPLLHIAAGHRSGTASWRTRVLLEGGQYRFEGRGKVSEEASGSRLALRASGSPRTAGRRLTTTDWVPLSHSFTVDGPMSEIMLVCEFSGPKGEAWFDIESLRLVRE
jgi:hypothetical protein